MKLVLFIFFSFIIVNIVYCRTIGQSLDAGIAHAREDAEAVGRVITAPIRYVGEKASHAVSSTRHAAGDVFEGAAQKLHYAGQRIRGDDNRSGENVRSGGDARNNNNTANVNVAQSGANSATRVD
uniref:Uncharacterized protein n=1 Tax=Panagrolaimus sp. PS1159 TaxID=55785 RepID=A0AC35F298_9BILA